MKKQPESFTLVRYQDSPFGCSIEGNALALQVSSVGGYALVAYINNLIEERAELLDALRKTKTCALPTEVRDVVTAAIAKATT